MERRNYRVSVIIGLYNCETTLQAALDSLVAQTYQDFKVIMCDDGSTDNTYNIASHYVAKYSNFHLIKNQKNRGLNHTLNHCLQYADTEIIARMDGDDISLPERFAEQIKILDENPEISVVGSAMIHFDEQGEFKISDLKKSPSRVDFRQGTPFCHATCMVRKSAYDAVGGYSTEKELLRVEDYHLWFKMYAVGLRGINILTPLYMMRDDRTAILRRKFKYRINEARVMYKGMASLSLPLYYRFYALKPILVGLLPNSIYKFIRKFDGM